MRKDYQELKELKVEIDIASAREKLMIFVHKLVEDTNNLIAHIEKDHAKN